MRTTRVSTLLFLFFFAAAGTLLAGTLEGTVFDPAGQVVPGARVSLKRWLVAIEERQADAHGIYRFEGLQDGSYQITATAPGLAGSSVTVEFHGTEGKKQDLHLELSAIAVQVVVSASLGGALAPARDRLGKFFRAPVSLSLLPGRLHAAEPGLDQFLLCGGGHGRVGSRNHVADTTMAGLVSGGSGVDWPGPVAGRCLPGLCLVVASRQRH